MSHFVPGKVVKSFTSKKGRSVELMYPKWEVVDQAQSYINALSKEDTFVSFSGEQLTLKEEAEFLAQVFVWMELQQAMYLFCMVDGQLAGICGIEQLPALRKRGKHVGTFGLSIGQEYRGDGLGFALAQRTIREAEKYIPGMKMVILTCFANNVPALALYKKLGFCETGRRVGGLLYRGEFIDEVDMTLALPSATSAV